MKLTLNDIPDVKPGKDVTRFGDDNFWKERYDKNGTVTFEWFLPFSDAVEQNQPFRALLQSRVAQKARVVDIGCGTSELCEELWDMGFRDVTGLDNQQAAIDYCRKRQGDRQINFVVGDMTKLPFEDKSVDVVMDKGALDALVCRGGEDLSKCAAEMWRVMKPANSLLIVLSNAPLMEIVDGLKPWFEKQQMTMTKHLASGQLMAKLYLFSRRKKKL
jgi:ubiquinone/menaquinone biosynthesis C-methylase UbiE